MTEELYTCPLDPVHQIRPRKFATHVFKCSRNHQNVELATCPNNKCHIFRKKDLETHMNDCPDKIYAEREALKTIKYFSASNYPAAAPEFAKIDDDDWGNQTYNSEPQLPLDCQILFKIISREPPKSLCPSIRKKWRAAEQLRLSKLDNNEPVDDVIFPTPTGGSESIRDILNRNQKKSSAAISTTTAAFQQEHNQNIMATAEPLKPKYVPSASQKDAPSGQNDDVNNPWQLQSKKQHDKRNGKVNATGQTSSEISFESNSSLKPGKRTVGYGRGYRRGAAQDTPVGGLNEKYNKFN